MLVSTPGDLKSAPPSELQLVSGPNIQRDLLRDPRNVARALRRRSDQLVNIRPSSSVRPILDALTMAAEPEGDSAVESELGTHHRREAHKPSLDEGAAFFGGPAARMKKVALDATALAGRHSPSRTPQPQPSNVPKCRVPWGSEGVGPGSPWSMDLF